MSRLWNESHSKSMTFCGTIMYIAPEMLKEAPYSKKVAFSNENRNRFLNVFALFFLQNL